MTKFRTINCLPGAALFLISQGCAHKVQNQDIVTILCDGGWIESAEVSQLNIRSYSDRHGDSATILKCTDRGFGLDYSESDLFSEKNINLLNQIRYNVNSERAPIDMTVSGVLISKEKRKYLKVRKIESYVLDRK